MNENYVLGPVIGRGAYGEVYAGFCKRTSEKVAIKRLKTKVASWDEALKLREIAALRVLNQHPHILKLREVFRDDSTQYLYLVFEFLGAGNLFQVLKLQNQGQSQQQVQSTTSLQTQSASAIDGTGASVSFGALWPLSRIRDVMFQLFSAVDYIHRNGFFHRDIKPENVMFFQQSSHALDAASDESKEVSPGHVKDFVKLVDFGVARRLPSKAVPSTRGSLDDSETENMGPAFTDYVATRWYRAPELVLGARYYNGSVDIWALGCILAELISGRPLFAGASTEDQLFRIASVIGSFDATSWPYGMTLLQRRQRSHPATQYPLCAPVKLSQILPRASPEALALLTSIFQWDPERRPTAKQCLESPFFAECQLPPVPAHPKTSLEAFKLLGAILSTSATSSAPNRSNQDEDADNEFDYVVSSNSATGANTGGMGSKYVANSLYQTDADGDKLPDYLNAIDDDDDDYVSPLGLHSWSKKRGDTTQASGQDGTTSSLTRNFSNDDDDLNLDEDNLSDKSPRLDADDGNHVSGNMPQDLLADEESEPLAGLEDEFESGIKEGLEAMRVSAFQGLGTTNLVSLNSTQSCTYPLSVATTNLTSGSQEPSTGLGVGDKSGTPPYYAPANETMNNPSSSFSYGSSSSSWVKPPLTGAQGLPPTPPSQPNMFAQHDTYSYASSGPGRHRSSLSTGSAGSFDQLSVGGQNTAPPSPSALPQIATPTQPHVISPAPLPSRVATSLLPPNLPPQSSSGLRNPAFARPPLSPTSSPHLSHPAHTVPSSAHQLNSLSGQSINLPVGPMYTTSCMSSSSISSSTQAMGLSTLVTTTANGRTTPTYHCPSPSSASSNLSISGGHTPPSATCLPPIGAHPPHPPASSPGSISPGLPNRDLSPIMRSQLMRDCPYPSAYLGPSATSPPSYPGATTPSSTSGSPAQPTRGLPVRTSTGIDQAYSQGHASTSQYRRSSPMSATRLGFGGSTGAGPNQNLFPTGSSLSSIVANPASQTPAPSAPPALPAPPAYGRRSQNPNPGQMNVGFLSTGSAQQASHTLPPY